MRRREVRRFLQVLAGIVVLLVAEILERFGYFLLCVRRKNWPSGRSGCLRSRRFRSQGNRELLAFSGREDLHIFG